MESSGRTVAAEGLWALIHREYVLTAQTLLYLFPAADCIKKPRSYAYMKEGELRVALVEFKAATLSANSHLHLKVGKMRG